MPDNKTRRRAIVESLAQVFRDEISLTNGYKTDLQGKVETRMVFWDSIDEWPLICIVAGTEQIVHQGAGFKDRYLELIVRVYVNEEDSELATEMLLEDIESVLETNGRLAYLDSSGVECTTRDIIITLIDTDQGTLAPLGVGEMTLQVKY